MSAARAIIIVDHGSTHAAANQMLEDLAEHLRQESGERVYSAHMELATPSLTEAFDAAVGDGAGFVFVFPYFLSPGRHSREDIPRLCAAAAARHAGLKWHCSGPIGLDRLMAELILRRLQWCEQHRYDCPNCPDADVCEAPARVSDPT